MGIYISPCSYFGGMYLFLSTMNIIYIPFYTEQNIARKRELDECLAANIMNKLIHKIVLIADETVGDHVTIPFEKVEIYRLKRRPTFADIFYQVIPKYSDSDDINLVSNSDIYFDDTLKKLNYVDWDKGICLALSRHDKVNGKWTNTPNREKAQLANKEYSETMDWDSQDVYVFKGHPKGMFCNFPTGTWGSDNRIVYELDKAGYWVFDLGAEIVCKHVHSDSLRKPRKDTDLTIPPPYKLLPKSNLYHIKTKPIIKIGHIGFDAFYGAEGAMGETLQEAGEYHFMSWLSYADNHYKIKDRAKFEEDVLKLTQWADIIFAQIQTPDVITVDLAKKMSAYRKKLFLWNGDVREQIEQWTLDLAPYFTALWSNDTDTQTMKDMGFKSEFMNVIFSPTKYNPKGYVEKREPILFFANNYWDNYTKKHKFPLGKERQDMAMFLIENYGKDFGLYGFGWDGLETGNINDDCILEASIYRGAKIGINYSHFNYSRYSSDRLFRIMGCGILCLTHNFKDIEKDFEVGKHLVTFDSLEDMKEKIDYYLTHEEEREKIAKAGCEYVHKNYGTGKLYKTILNIK